MPLREKCEKYNKPQEMDKNACFSKKSAKIFGYVEKK